MPYYVRSLAELDHDTVAGPFGTAEEAETFLATLPADVAEVIGADEHPHAAEWGATFDPEPRPGALI